MNVKNLNSPVLIGGLLFLASRHVPAYIFEATEFEVPYKVTVYKVHNEKTCAYIVHIFNVMEGDPEDHSLEIFDSKEKMIQYLYDTHENSIEEIARVFNLKFWESL